MRKLPRVFAIGLAGATAMAQTHPSCALELHATPRDYVTKVKELQAGDVLYLAPGEYTEGLSIIGLSGTARAPIRIAGEQTATPPTLRAQRGRNTISIVDSTHVEIDRLDLDGGNLEVDAVKAEGHANFADHITLSHLRIRNYSRDQQTVGISTKCPAWGWSIKENEIVGVGTGIYLGNSDGSAPFVGGSIVGNLIVDTTGYNIEIKHQTMRPSIAGMPSGKERTVIRDNVLSKSDRSATGELARPNLLVGHFPIDFAGRDDEYLIYGNLIYDNPSEALLQAEGNVAIYNNVLINPRGDALAIQPHHDRPRKVRVFGNTIIAKRTGIRVVGIEAATTVTVVGNVVYADSAIVGIQSGANVTGALDRARHYLRNPYAAAGEGLDVTPRRRLPRYDFHRFSDLPASTLSFDGRVRKSGGAGAYEMIDTSAKRSLALVRKAIDEPQ